MKISISWSKVCLMRDVIALMWSSRHEHLQLPRAIGKNPVYCLFGTIKIVQRGRGGEVWLSYTATKTCLCHNVESHIPLSGTTDLSVVEDGVGFRIYILPLVF